MKASAKADQRQPKSERRVWIAQCLCPQRHAILAASAEADSEAAAWKAAMIPLNQNVASLLRAGVINPWCGICRSPVETWTYDLGRTRFRSTEEARGPLEQLEREQAATRAVWGDMPRSD